MAIGTARGQTVAISGGEDGDVRLWRLTESSPIGVSLGGRISNAVKTVAIGAAHGRDLALAGSDDGAIRLWDLATARLYGPGLTGPGTGPEALGICSLNARTTVLSGHWDGTLWTWSL
ncbi:hypothetical protein [Frankia canadensis]|nr:hypothetical protein [Frankia canadensis]